jgi:hypothetical protein
MELNNVLKKFNMETIPPPVQDFSDIFKNNGVVSTIPRPCEQGKFSPVPIYYQEQIILNNYPEEQQSLTNSFNSDDFKDSSEDLSQT